MTITKEHIEKYLKDKYSIKASDLFLKGREHDPTAFELKNEVCKKFANCWIENHVLCSDNPSSLTMITYANYTSFNHLKSLDEFVTDLNKMLMLKEEHGKQFNQQIQDILDEEKKNKQDEH